MKIENKLVVYVIEYPNGGFGKVETYTDEIHWINRIDYLKNSLPPVQALGLHTWKTLADSEIAAV